MLIGLIGAMIPWSNEIRNMIVKFIFHDTLAISLFGYAFFLIGLALAADIVINIRKRPYKISSLKGPIAVDEAVIQTYLNEYWKQLFPENDVPCHVSLKDNKIHVAVDLPYLPIQEQKTLLERIRKDLIGIFTKILGYRDEFYISASFQENRSELAKN